MDINNLITFREGVILAADIPNSPKLQHKLNEHLRRRFARMRGEVYEDFVQLRNLLQRDSFSRMGIPKELVTYDSAGSKTRQRRTNFHEGQR